MEKKESPITKAKKKQSKTFGLTKKDISILQEFMKSTTDRLNRFENSELDFVWLHDERSGLAFQSASKFFNAGELAELGKQNILFLKAVREKRESPPSYAG